MYCIRLPHELTEVKCNFTLILWIATFIPTLRKNALTVRLAYVLGSLSPKFRYRKRVNTTGVDINSWVATRDILSISCQVEETYLKKNILSHCYICLGSPNVWYWNRWPLSPSIRYRNRFRTRVVDIYVWGATGMYFRYILRYRKVSE